VRKLLHEHLGDDQPQHPVAQELELLVVVLAHARMRQRAPQKRRIAKLMAERLAQLVGGFVIRQV
jgi:hypothetical protein